LHVDQFLNVWGYFLTLHNSLSHFSHFWRFTKQLFFLYILLRRTYRFYLHLSWSIIIFWLVLLLLIIWQLACLVVINYCFYCTLCFWIWKWWNCWFQYLIVSYWSNTVHFIVVLWKSILDLFRKGFKWLNLIDCFFFSIN